MEDIVVQNGKFDLGIGIDKSFVSGVHKRSINVKNVSKNVKDVATESQKTETTITKTPLMKWDCTDYDYLTFN